MKGFRNLLCGMSLCLALGGVSTSWASECVEVKGWETLDDPVRLCAYLTDPGEAGACRQRGYRLGEDVTEADVGVAKQFVLLCANEYVIGVAIDSRSDSGADRLEVTTAIVEVGDAASGYYDRGQVRLLERMGAGWVQRPGQQWSE